MSQQKPTLIVKISWGLSVYLFYCEAQVGEI